MENIYKSLHSNQKILIYEMLKRGINVKVIDEENEIIKTSYKGHDELICDRDSSIMPYNASVLSADKGFTKKYLASNSISVPIGEVFLAKDIEYIIKAFNYLNCPVVLKSPYKSHGFDVYTDLKTKDDVAQALYKIIKNNGEDTKVIIEEHYNAQAFRVFITKNGDYAVIKREPAYVIGDGVNDIEYLISNYNYKRRDNNLTEIIINDDVISYLAKKNLNTKSIIPTGEKVYLSSNYNSELGALYENYTDKVHPSIIEICMKVLNTLPGMPYAEIDLMTNTINQAQNIDSYRIIKVNSVPDIKNHFYPAFGNSENIAKYIVDMIYPETVDIVEHVMEEEIITK